MAGSSSFLQSVRKSVNENLSVIDEQSFVSAAQSSDPSAAGRSPAGSAQGGSLKRVPGIGSDGRVEASGAHGVASLRRNRPLQGAHERRASAARSDTREAGPAHFQAEAARRGSARSSDHVADVAGLAKMRSELREQERLAAASES